MKAWAEMTEREKLDALLPYFDGDEERARVALSIEDGNALGDLRVVQPDKAGRTGPKKASP